MSRFAICFIAAFALTAAGDMGRERMLFNEGWRFAKGVTSLAGKGTAIRLAGNPDDAGSLAQPKNVFPATKTLRGIKPGFTCTMPSHSIVVLKLKAQP